MKKLKFLASPDEVELSSLNECHFQQHGTRCRMWVPSEDKDPVVSHASARESISCFGAVSLRSDKLEASEASGVTVSTTTVHNWRQSSEYGSWRID